ncbi:hypothetical protein L195_g031991 [Trifolium pratense]|uniref:Uncharacterized protein n=1 Tax=Trifolium pratense TaxID=57577 RepID=A0A2K3LBY8_TRIPR|nr:hypothetical protein L195_g031991 [Trifolium pratense]
MLRSHCFEEGVLLNPKASWRWSLSILETGKLKVQGLVKVVECKESLMLRLVEPPKISKSEAIVSSGVWKGTFRGSKRVRCKLVELPKNPMVVGGKIFMRTEGIPRYEGMRYKPGNFVLDGSSRLGGTVVDGKFASPSI